MLHNSDLYKPKNIFFTYILYMHLNIDPKLLLLNFVIKHYIVIFFKVFLTISGHRTEGIDFERLIKESIWDTKV